jgi:nicotinamidase-related amidase
MIKNKKILDRKSTALLMIDVQEKILNVILNKEELVKNTCKLIDGFRILNIPVFYTEQYPKGLGPTNEIIREHLSGIEPISKMSFSCNGAGDLFNQLKSKNISQVVVCGIESHVCVQQTVLDLLANEFQVNVAADAVSSRKETDLKISLERMNRNGTEITTVESILFELLSVAGTEEFKAISKIIK